MIPSLDADDEDKRPVPDMLRSEDGTMYQILLSDNIPLFSYYCRGTEIFRRLVLKYAYTESLEAFKEKYTEFRFLNTPRKGDANDEREESDSEDT